MELECEDATPRITRTRIHVGGLGENVTEDEVKKMFTSVGGVVEGVEIIRTKGRSFAYIDFSPSTDKSLPKLFSTYNGCMWKGGRLRLEKAKEQYLVRLKREWAREEDARQRDEQKKDAQQQDAKEKQILSSQYSKKFNKDSLDAKQIQIFFPRLNKMKSLLFSGSGKHRYSFPRVEVPSHQKHFCDCEEHSVPSHTATKKQISEQQAEGDVINEEELNIMNSVMNKLFEKESASNVVNHVTGLAQEEGDSLELMDDIQSDENEADEDNLIINMVTRGNNKKKQQADFVNKESRFDKKRPSEDYPTEDSFEIQKISNVPPKKKVRFLLDEESRKNDSLSAISGGKESSQDHLNVSQTLSGVQTTKTESGKQRSSTSFSWSQKSSWKELVGNRDNSAFSVTQILPSSISSEEVQPISEDLNVSDSPNDESDEQPESEDLGMSDSPNDESNASSEDERPESEDLNVSDSPNDESDTSSDGEQPKSEDLNVASPNDEYGTSSSEEEQPKSEDLNVASPNDEYGTSSSEEKQPKSEDLNVSDSPNDLASHKNAEGQSGNLQAMDGIAEAQPTKPTTNSNKSDRGASWLQQSSWTQLVTEKNTLFSISQILPGLSFEKQKLPLTNGVDVANSADSKNVEDPKHVGHQNKELLTPSSSKEPNFAGSDANQSAPEKKHISPSNQASIWDTKISKTCSFMRSAESLKEWANAKAALSGSLKRKSNEK